MSSPPTPPAGYRLAERGGSHPGALNRIFLPVSGRWIQWGQIDADCWRPWFDGTPVYYAVADTGP